VSHGLFEVAVFLGRAAEPVFGLKFRQGDGSRQLLQFEDLVRERVDRKQALVELRIAGNVSLLNLSGTLSIADFGNVFDRRYGTGFVDPQALDDCWEQITAELMVLLEAGDLVDERLADGDDDVGFQSLGCHCNDQWNDLRWAEVDESSPSWLSAIATRLHVSHAGARDIQRHRRSPWRAETILQKPLLAMIQDDEP
jgi:hypothetical protein